MIASLRAPLALLVGGLALACGEPPKPAAKAEPAPPPTHYLDEWFALGSAQCRITQAERTLVEQRAGEGQVAEDVFVVDTAWLCQRAGGRRVSLTELLSQASEVAWIDDDRRAHPRAASATPESIASEHVRFTVAAERDGLPRPRKYDPKTGAPLLPREERQARLTIASGTERIAVAPWTRLQDAALDHLLDGLARSLATGSAAPELAEGREGRAMLDEARSLFQQARAAFAPQLVALKELREVEGQPRAVLGFERSRIEDAVASTLRFEFELALDGGRATVRRLLDAEGMRAQLACVEGRRALFSRIERRLVAGPECNVAAVLVPSRCDEVEPSLLADALRYGSRCGAGSSVDLVPSDDIALPDDFEVRLVRGRERATLDRSPRYTMSIDRRGEVRFVGEHWVSSAGQSTGRTAEPLLRALYAKVLRLGWFERPDPHGRRHCQKEGHGDVIRVVADGRDRLMRDREGCRAPFTAHELATLRRAIEYVGGVDAWTAPTPDGATRDDQIWVVAAE